MTSTDQRPIDLAMTAQHETKAKIRQLWVDVIRLRHAHSTYEPLYVTLCGAAGLDIESLLDAKIIKKEPSGAIDPKGVRQVVAFEKDMTAAVALKNKFPGLDVKQQNIHEQLQIQSFFREPSTKNRKIFSAPVINLDYDSSVKYASGRIPIVDACQKISNCHQDHSSWSLLLTVNASLNWTIEQQNLTRDLINQTFLGAELHQEFADFMKCNGMNLMSDKLDLQNLLGVTSQRFMAAALPLLISDKLASDHWTVTFKNCIMYQGGGGAPMVTWILDIDYDESAASKRIERGRNLLVAIASGAVLIGV